MEAAHIGELRRFFADGGTLHMLNDTSVEEMDTLWRYACQLLHDGDINGGRNLLQLLVYCNQWNGDYLLSLGLACQLGGAYQDACVYLAQAARVLVTDPRPPWLLGQCAQALDQEAEARTLYKSALKLANDRPEWRELTTSARERLANGHGRAKQEKKR
ncbi:MAG: hypothetical protein ACRCZ6_17665 [Kluyvera sp.]|jgi:tetratricopeptide (TPR) repeat protein|uniref:hypothetical protein n=1 Tax=Kluyvera sp. TaxID=1538228 RepID=UPI003F36CD46